MNLRSGAVSEGLKVQDQPRESFSYAVFPEAKDFYQRCSYMTE